MDNTTLHPSCAHVAHLVDVHLWRGAPQNQDAERPVQLNHGYVVGFSQLGFMYWLTVNLYDAERVLFAEYETRYGGEAANKKLMDAMVASGHFVHTMSGEVQPV